MVNREITKGLVSLSRPKLSKNHKRSRMKLKNYMKLKGGGMIENSNYIGTSLNESIQEIKLKRKYPIQFLHKYINKVGKKYHWVGHSKLK